MDEHLRKIFERLPSDQQAQFPSIQSARIDELRAFLRARGIDVDLELAKAEDTRRRSPAALPSTHSPGAVTTGAPSQRRTSASGAIRVNQLAKELGVESKSILAKCREEGLGEKVPNHMVMLSIGLAETIREWFSGAMQAQGPPHPVKPKLPSESEGSSVPLPSKADGDGTSDGKLRNDYLLTAYEGKGERDLFDPVGVGHQVGMEEIEATDMAYALKHDGFVYMGATGWFMTDNGLREAVRIKRQRTSRKSLIKNARRPSTHKGDGVPGLGDPANIVNVRGDYYHNVGAGVQTIVSGDKTNIASGKQEPSARVSIIHWLWELFTNNGLISTVLAGIVLFLIGLWVYRRWGYNLFDPSARSK